MEGGEVSNEWGPWIEHDGKGGPMIPEGLWVQRQWSDESGSRKKSPTEEANGWCLNSSPGWTWRWRKKSLFSRERIRVCDDKEYQPIIRFRIRKDFGQEAQEEQNTQVDMLKDIAAGKRQPSEEPA